MKNLRQVVIILLCGVFWSGSLLGQCPPSGTQYSSNTPIGDWTQVGSNELELEFSIPAGYYCTLPPLPVVFPSSPGQKAYFQIEGCSATDFEIAVYERPASGSKELVRFNDDSCISGSCSGYSSSLRFSRGGGTILSQYELHFANHPCSSPSPNGGPLPLSGIVNVVVKYRQTPAPPLQISPSFNSTQSIGTSGRYAPSVIQLDKALQIVVIVYDDIFVGTKAFISPDGEGALNFSFSPGKLENGADGWDENDPCAQKPKFFGLDVPEDGNYLIHLRSAQDLQLALWEDTRVGTENMFIYEQDSFESYLQTQQVDPPCDDDAVGVSKLAEIRANDDHNGRTNFSALNHCCSESLYLLKDKLYYIQVDIKHDSFSPVPDFEGSIDIAKCEDYNSSFETNLIPEFVAAVGTLNHFRNECFYEQPYDVSFFRVPGTWNQEDLNFDSPLIYSIDTLQSSEIEIEVDGDYTKQVAVYEKDTTGEEVVYRVLEAVDQSISGGPKPFYSKFSISGLQKGQTYYVLIDGFQSERGEGTFLYREVVKRTWWQRFLDWLRGLFKRKKNTEKEKPGKMEEETPTNSRSF